MNWIRRYHLFLGVITSILILHLLGILVSTTVEFGGEPVGTIEAILSLRNLDSVEQIDSYQLNSFMLLATLALLAPMFYVIKTEKARLTFACVMLLAPIAFGIVDGLTEKLFVLFTSPIWAPALTIMMIFGFFDGESWAEGMAAFAAQTWWLTLWWFLSVRTTFRAFHRPAKNFQPLR
ncbi:MAG: hypothetical protein IT366_07670 [Candidatus Hydrogenedentes bacterium]|nr:hypothetical protein [Candidatus Hydrogenedentota bacterium]